MYFNVFRQLDNNGIYIVDGSVSKIESELNDKQVQFFISKINAIIGEYLSDSNVYYSIIPDKNYFMADKNGYPSLDYGTMLKAVLEGVDVEDAEYIDIFKALSIDDYYTTDAHWRQENLGKVLNTLATALGVADFISDMDEYTVEELKPFYGVYWGQSALALAPDTLKYLTNASLLNAQVHSIESENPLTVYRQDLFDGTDGYDVFLSGPQALLTIINPDGTDKSELVIFRDSFGGSIAPLLLEGYSKITLIDLRYISSTLISDYVEFNGQDVLFLYSTSLINSGMLLK